MQAYTLKKFIFFRDSATHPVSYRWEKSIYFFVHHVFIYIYVLLWDKVGEKFGMAAAACDVTGDGLHDLIVGAPFYSPDNQV
jgi:FG-GAP repeat